jgi:hypothetical protein
MMATKPVPYKEKAFVFEARLSKQDIQDMLSDMNDVDAIDLIIEYLATNKEAYNAVEKWVKEAA